MAVYRSVHISYWQDDFVLSLTPEEKFFYLYLMTNSKTTQCGIYEISIKIMMFETGYNEDTVDKLLKRFIDYDKIIYSAETNEILIVNWIKYNPLKSPNILKCVNKEIELVKNDELVLAFNEANNTKYKGLIRDYIGASKKEEEEKEEEQEETKEKEEEKEEYYMSTLVDSPKSLTTSDYQSIMEYWNIKSKLKEITIMTDKRKGNINARFKEFDLKAIYKAIDNCSNSSFMRGHNSKNWMATFDWVFLPTNFPKVLEGNYLDKTPATFDNEIERRVKNAEAKIYDFMDIGEMPNDKQRSIKN